tara:strand:+ start:1897 stop:2058 length:162 start_codon:yes stop_codon:yes gene_type:complete
MPTKTDIRYEPLSPKRSRLKQFNTSKINKENINNFMKSSSINPAFVISMEDMK